ncbi:hypothetical protein D3C79_843160 [compost metagenome]
MLALDTSSSSVSNPSAPHSWMSGPLICAAAGGLPEMARVLSTVMAAAPPPPATALSFQMNPSFCTWALRVSTALASPPEVHQCRTSTVPVSAAMALSGNKEARETTAARRLIAFMGRNLFLLLCRCKSWCLRLHRSLTRRWRGRGNEGMRECHKLVTFAWPRRQSLLRGRLKVTRKPPPCRLRKLTSPPWLWAMLRAIPRPRP